MTLAKLREFKAHYTSPEFQGFITAHGLRQIKGGKIAADRPLHIKLAWVAEPRKEIIRITFKPRHIGSTREVPIIIKALQPERETQEKAEAIRRWHYERGGYGPEKEGPRFGHANVERFEKRG